MNVGELPSLSPAQIRPAVVQKVLAHRFAAWQISTHRVLDVGQRTFGIIPHDVMRFTAQER